MITEDGAKAGGELGGEVDEEEQEEERIELDGLDLRTAKLGDMAEALRRLEREKRSLLDSIRLLRVRLSDEKADQTDVYYYLHKKLDDNYDVISALERQLIVETADREKAETEYNRQIDELEHRREEELAPLREKVITMEEQVNGMHEAADNKRESDASRARLEEEVKLTEATVESDLNVERRKKLQEKQRVRRQVKAQIKELSAELFSKKEVELADKTVRAADNNTKLHAALQAKAKQAERIMVMNQGLAFENSSLRNDVDLAKTSAIVLGKRVRRYHDLVINLKDQLETAASTEGDRKHERDLLLLDKSLGGSAGGGQSDGWINGNYGEGQSMTDGAGSGGALDTMSLSSDTPPGGHVIWAGGACDGLSYGSVDELRVARESLQRLHAELQEEDKKLTERVTRAHTENDRLRARDNPVACWLLTATEEWMRMVSQSRSWSQSRLKSATPDHDSQEQAGGAIKVKNDEDGSSLDYLGQLSGITSKCSDSTTLGCEASYTIGSNRTSNNSVRSRRIKVPSRRNVHHKRSHGKGADSNEAKNASAPPASMDRSIRRDLGSLASPGEESRQRRVREGKELDTVPHEITRGTSEGGPLLLAAATPTQRRDLFYHLVDAFRDFQTRTSRRNKASVHGNADAGSAAAHDDQEDAQMRVNSNDQVLSCMPGSAAVAKVADAGERSGDGTLPQISVGRPCAKAISTGSKYVGGNDGGGCVGGASASDLSSASVRTLRDFGPAEHRSASTQTVAKHFPEKFASVRPARKLLVTSTFLTSNSVFSAITTHGSTSDNGGGGLSIDTRVDRRY